jgi:outer membrane autotransporter protein
MKRARTNPNFLSLIVSTTLIVALFSQAAPANITTTGDVDPLYDDSDPWHIDGDLTIGVTSNANMAITDGSGINSHYSFIGYDSTASGLVTVTGEQSYWEHLNELYVGFFGQGELTVSDSGKVISDEGIYIGGGMMWYLGSHEDTNDLPSQLNSIGQVTVTEPNSIMHTDGSLFVGACGQGELTISDGATVTNYYTWIGLDPNLSELDPNIPSFDSTGVGTVSVTGAGSLLHPSDVLIVGALGGQGELTVSDGGTVISTLGYIGGFDPNLPEAFALDPNGIGHVTVTGSDSLWQTDSLYVGVWGQGQLDIFDGGLVDANSVFVGSTGIITGDGTIRTELLTNDGTIKPGSSIGTLTIDGDVLMDSNSILEIEIDNSGNSDKLVVTGDVNIVGGTVKAITTETITGLREYTILEANSVTGDFNSLDTVLLKTSILYPYPYLTTDTNAVILQVYPYYQFDNSYICVTANQIAVGKALQHIAESGGNTTTTTLQDLKSFELLRNAYDQLSGQTRLPLAPISVADTTKFLAMPANRLGDLQGGLAGVSGDRQLFAMARPDGRFGGSVYDTSSGGYMFALGNGTTLLSNQRWGAWGKGYGLFGNREAENSEPGYQYTIYGAGFGIDYQFTEQLLLGITGGYSNGDVDHSSSSDISDIRGKHIGVYGTVESEPRYFNAILIYSTLEYQTQRYVDMTAERLDGDFGGYAATGYLEAGFNWIWSDDETLIRPSASIQFSYLDLDGYTESGGSSSLTYEGQIYQSCKGSLGFRITPDLSRNPQGREALIELRGRWVHEFRDVKSSLPVYFASDPGAAFTISDESISRDSAVLGAGLHVKLGSNGRLFVDYDASLASHYTAHAVCAGLEYKW